MRLFKKKVEVGTTGDLIASPKDDRDYLLSSYMPKIQRYPVEYPPLFDLDVLDQKSEPSCFPSQTPVLVEDFSYKPISEIRVGDLVFTHKGRLRKVTERMKRVWQGTTRTMFFYGDYRGVEATPEHPIFSIKRPEGKRRRYIGDRKMEWIKTSEIIEKTSPDFYPIKDLEVGDWVGMPFNNIVRDTTIYSFEKDPEFLWVLGLYLAEGCVKKHEVSFSLHIKETHFYDRVKSAMEKYDANVTFSLLKESNGLVVRINGTKWADVFLELGGKLCDQKEINKRLMFIEPYLQMKIYEGMLDGDGHINKRKHETIVSTSEKLLIQLRTILLRNKMYSSLQKRKERDNRKPVWVLERYDNNFRSFIKDSYIFSSIKSIEHKKAFEGGNVYNLEVEEDNSYIVNSVAVHNCVGHAVAGMKQYNELKEKTYKVFDGNWIYRECKKVDGMPDFPGTFFRSGLQVLKDVGAKTGDEDPSKYKITSYALVDDMSFEGLKKAICLYGVVLAGFRGSNEGWSSEIVRPRKAGETEWGHAVFAVGYEKNYIIYQNSWGTKYHRNGLLKAPANYLPFEAWVILLDSENKATPKTKTGWVALTYVKNNITTANLNVRERAGTSARILTTLPKGTSVELTGLPSCFADGHTWVEIYL